MKRQEHGLSRTPAYPVWCNMKTRCYNESSTFYAEYGGRGITVCERWRESFSAFYEDMGERPAGMTIERLDNDKGYEPGNCVWATRKVQSRNRRGRRLLTIDGKTQTMAEWSEECGIALRTIWERCNLGWSDADAVTTPVWGAGRGSGSKRHATAAERDVDLHYREAA
jgi:hypothetical protein